MREGEILVITRGVRKGAVGGGRGNTGHNYGSKKGGSGWRKGKYPS